VMPRGDLAGRGDVARRGDLAGREASRIAAT